MKKLILICNICIAIIGLCPFLAKSQENEISFKEFINLLEQKEKDKNLQIADSVYLLFINDVPKKDDESETEISVLLNRVGFVGLIVYTLSDMERSEESQLCIYDWEGNLITDFDYGSGTYGDYFSESIVCQLKANDELECKHYINEGGLKEVLDDEGNVTGMNYITVKDEVTFEYYKILPNGNIETIETEAETD